MGPGHGGKFLSPPARPVPPTPGSVSQASQAWLAPWELRPRKSGSQDPNNWGACGRRQQKLQVAAITLLRPLLHMRLAPLSGRKASWYTRPADPGARDGASTRGFVISWLCSLGQVNQPLLVSAFLICKRSVVNDSSGPKGLLQRVAVRTGQVEVLGKYSINSKFQVLQSPLPVHSLSFQRLTPFPGPKWKIVRRQEFRTSTANSTKTFSVLQTAQGLCRSNRTASAF